MKPLTRVALPLLAVLAALGLATGPAAAHGGDGEIEITATTRSGDDVTVEVRLIYVDDGHGVPDATVTVVVDDATPVPMTPGAEEGDYTATVVAPPGATIRVTSVEPPTSTEAAAPAAGTAPADPGAPTTEPGSAATITDEPDAAGEAPTPISADPEDEEAAADEAASGAATSDDGGVSPIVVAAIAAVVLAAVAAAVLLLRRPRTDGEAGG